MDISVSIKKSIINGQLLNLCKDLENLVKKRDINTQKNYLNNTGSKLVHMAL